MNAITKMYDYILTNRLERWFKPDSEQAGSQRNRSCMEHITTLRLLMNYTIETKQKLFVLFVDFSKAFDRIPRAKLLQDLNTQGIGNRMLKALAALYKPSLNIIGTTTASSKAGVRQGAPSSGFLFTFYVNKLIRKLKEFGDDGYLKELHCTMLMDDTAIFATSREHLLQKIKVLTDFCEEYQMIINEEKTKFMVIGGNHIDRKEIQTVNIKINNCDEYNYLGMVFTQNGKQLTALQRQASTKQKHLLKLAQYTFKNKDHPIHVKMKVLQAAFNAALLYGIESWIDCDMSTMNAIYIKAIKLVLGIRENSTNEICLA